MAQAITAKLLSLANARADSPLRGASPGDVEMMDGRLRLKREPSRSLAIAELMRGAGVNEITDEHDSRPSPERAKYTSMAHGAQFVEVKIDPDLGTVRVARVVEVTACGRILNPLASHSQEIGGVVWGIGMALEERPRSITAMDAS